MVAEGVEAALKVDLSKMDAEVATSSLAVLALAMARAVDKAPAAIMCAELASLISQLRELSPPVVKSDRMDALQAQRDKRRHSA